MSKVIAICNQKGGVWKTTTAANLGVALTKEGNNVLVIDLDPQADLSCCLGVPKADELEVTVADMMTKAINEETFNWQEGLIKSKEGVYVLPSNLDLSAMEMNLVGTMNRERILKGYVDKVKKNFDYVIIDCMPSLGMITINALSAADSVSIPVQAHYLPAKGMEQLPKASDNNDRVIEYLKDRGVDEELVRKCIYEGIIYEDSRFHSAIFVGFDEQGKPAHASYRSTNGSGLKGDLRGSNKAYSFRIEQKSGDKVRVFESAIDLLSYASICKLKGCEEELGSLISTSGIYSSKNEEYKLPMALETYLERHPETKTVILQLDNDEAGLKAATEIRSKLKSKQ